MGAFGIYVIVLTVIYVIYYGVMLAYDQYGVKGQKKNEVEEFDSPDDDHKPSSRRVRENGDGSFSVTDDDDDDAGGGDDGDGGIFDETPSQEEISGEQDPDEVPVGGGGDKDTDESFDDYQRLIALQDDMMTVIPEFEEQYDSAGFSVVMNQPLDVQSRVHRTVQRY